MDRKKRDNNAAVRITVALIFLFVVVGAWHAGIPLSLHSGYSGADHNESEILLHQKNPENRETQSLSSYEWTRYYDWIRDFEYERIPVAQLADRRPPDELYVPAYTLEMIDRYMASLGNVPWVMPTLSADDRMIVGYTPGWPVDTPVSWPDEQPLQGWEDLDFHVPPQKVYGFMITNPETGTENKIKVILTAGIHPAEFNGNWALHAMIDFLISDDSRAGDLRDKAVFYVYPSINPDGRYLQEQRLDRDDLLREHPAEFPYVVRANPEMYAGGMIDQNRAWQTDGRFEIIDLLKKVMHHDTGGYADYSWDFHGGFRIRHDYRGPPWSMESRYAGALKQREPGVPRLVRREIMPLRLWGWLALDDNEVYVRYPFLYEPHCMMEKERIFEVGQSLALAFLDVVSGTAPYPSEVELPGPDPDPNYRITRPEAARRITERAP